MTKDGVERHIEPKVMKVLLMLASQQGHVVSKEELISAVWSDTFVSDDVLTRCISILRRITEDDPHTPRFIQTIPKVGYRLVVEVNELPEEETPGFHTVTAMNVVESEPVGIVVEASDTLTSPERSSRRERVIAVGLAVTVLVASIVAIWSYQRARIRAAGANTSFKTIQFTSYAGEQTQPAFAPDGKRIAFVWTTEDSRSRRIYIKTIGSEDIRPLTLDTEDQQFSPTWSPDGRQIAYLVIAKDGLSLYVADVESKTPPRRLLIPQEPSHWEQGASPGRRRASPLYIPITRALSQTPLSFCSI
jgi:DNA-binding winged helix-turn-helix (wHTH) protein